MITSLGAADLITARRTPKRPAARKARTNRNETRDRQLAALMRSTQGGDRIAYVSLLKEVAHILKRAVQAQAWFLPATDREDLVQDILLSLHTARATYDSERPFMPWLMSIAHNRMVDNARRNSRRFANEVLVDDLPVSLAGESASPATSEYRDTEALRHAVRNLPPGQRTAIELLKLREMSLKEAAQSSGMSIGALKISTHRAIKSLRASLNS